METINNIQGEVRALGKDVEETRTVTFIASTDTKDRHGTVLNMDNWSLKNFNNNPIIGYQHNVYGGGMCSEPNPDDQLGSAKAYKEGNLLLVDVTFEPAEINPKAEKIFRKVLHGSLRAVSVGFLPLKDKDGNEGDYGRKNTKSGKMEQEDTFFYYGQELLEVSVVNIPSNPDALKRSMRDSTSSALTFLTKELNLRYSEVEDMKVRDILDILDGKEVVEEINNDKIKEQRLKLLSLKINKTIK